MLGQKAQKTLRISNLKLQPLDGQKQVAFCPGCSTDYPSFVVEKKNGEMVGFCPLCKLMVTEPIESEQGERSPLQTGRLEQNKIHKPLPTVASIAKETKAQIVKNKQWGSLGIDPGFEFLRKTIVAIILAHLWIFGGYTSHGKTALIIELIKRVLKIASNTKITVFSLEMDRISYLLRLVSSVSKIPSLAILRGDHIPEVEERIDNAFTEISQWPLIIFDNLYEWPKIAGQATEINDDVGLDILVIDFIQNIWGKGSIYERMSQLAPKIQALAKQLNCTILALSQVSNEAINEDLRSIGYKGAGELAASCDLGLWLERDRKEDDLLHVMVRKNRHGPVGKTKLRFKDNFTWLCEESEVTRGVSWIEDG